ncbi:MAG: hypothetical protein JXA25_09045 [Anaerolineales bacterium]|nr:hypothetical protein [Anaerolineales bacterium]
MLQVEVRIQGQLDQKWADWLEGFAITHCDEGETLLSGTVLDQAAAYGLIAKLRDLGVKLVSVEISELGEEPDSSTDRTV